MGMGTVFFFVMIRMALGTHLTVPGGNRIEQKGSIFFMQVGCVFNLLFLYSLRVEVKNAPVNVLRAWCHTRGITLYVLCMFSSRSAFSIRIVFLFIYFFVKRLYTQFL